ncbi:Sulfate transporter 1.2 [Apostasia shenzhenica]|uniref:Sulfate transporter 1.2 n=1 Tax=Apostasia shenzhenica TaxID=1088818 RepID=A0A2I0BCX8_9ASPA|nr:Sulfate transporter 1.2 [Apostasia shenzhenica]
MHCHSQQKNHKSPPSFKVGCPPRKKFLREFAEAFKETFFPDDPLRPYKDQTRTQKFMLGLQFFFPIFDWGRDYNLQKFRGALIAGLTIATL